MRTTLALLGVCGLLWALTFLHEPPTSADGDAPITGEIGAPMAGLDAGTLALFNLGREVFVKRFTPEEGLGPSFNATSCVSCHEDPAPGGSSQRYRDFFLVGRTQPDGKVTKAYPDCTSTFEIDHPGEPCLPSLVIANFGPREDPADVKSTAQLHPPIPDDCDVVARRNAPPIFGIGVFRLITDAEILSRADPGDADGDGISGRVNIISKEDSHIGRFGYKCQTASIEAFNRGALHNQMGITSNSLQTVDALDPRSSRERVLDSLLGIRKAYAQVANPKDRITDFDNVFDPEISRLQLQALVAFQENLAAPQRGPLTQPVVAGEQRFTALGCQKCHAPTLNTPLGAIHPYTDLLIHDMGPLLADGVVMELATSSEFRTQPLWGLCHHPPFLHDGRADTIEDAILEHGGEAQASRDAYAGLSDEQKKEVLSFLESL